MTKKPAAKPPAKPKRKYVQMPKAVIEAKKAFIEDAERIYRRYCRGLPGLDGALAHVVKTLELRGHDITIEQVRTWAIKHGWNEKVERLDAKTYAAVDIVRAKRAQMTASGRADLEAMRETIDELTNLAMDMTAKASAALEGVEVETLNDVATLARTAKDVAESSMRVREAMARYTPPGLKAIEATSDGKPVNAEMIPPPATETVPTLEAAVAQFERGARAGQKH
jgi:hypothetical protein